MLGYFIELCVRGILELRGNDNEPAGCTAAAGAVVTDVPVGVVVGDRAGRRVVMSVSTLRDRQLHWHASARTTDRVAETETRDCVARRRHRT